MNRLILLRHGESEWNKKNIFTGWVDIPLSRKGIQEALDAGKFLQKIPIDRIYTSTLIRGLMTAMLCMTTHSSQKVPYVVHPGNDKHAKWNQLCNPAQENTLIPVICAWQLNERMYGKLQGYDKQQMREKFGEDQVKIWRRSFATPPPEGESLQMTAKRTIPYFESQILPRLNKGETILISAHGNSLRSIVMDLDHLNKEEILELEIPTGKPLIYIHHKGHLKREENA